MLRRLGSNRAAAPAGSDKITGKKTFDYRKNMIVSQGVIRSPGSRPGGGRAKERERERKREQFLVVRPLHNG